MFHLTILQLLSVSIIYVSSISAAPTKQNPERNSETYPPYTCYECFGSSCNNPYNVTCDVGLTCFTHTEIIDGTYLYREKGCHRVPFIALVHCNSGIVRKRGNETNPVHTCCNGDFCNDEEFEIPNITKPLIPYAVSLPKIKDEQMKKNNFEEIILVKQLTPCTGGIDLTHASFQAFALAFLNVFILVLGCFFSMKKLASYMKKPDVLLKLHHKPTANDKLDGAWSSGSGSGSPTLNQRCFSQDVSLIKCIGKGRFGEVWKGTMLGENIAVKIFSTVDVASWGNEVNIYTNIALYHENVLGFKGSNVTTRLGSTELWLLTAFHERGSLYDYLLENTVSLKEMMVFVQSICSGLLHLHTEMIGSIGKPAIAHRDLKTRNILVTSHGTCVIADFGLAIIKTSDFSSTNYAENYRVGTKRYMAPEVLDESMKTNIFESFKRADIYAFGLVLWEICSRCVTEDTPFRLAFHDCVPDNPDFEDMKKVVCDELKRPEIPDRWLSDEALNAMAKLMQHCWHKFPEVRCTALRVWKTLDRIHTQIQELQPNVEIV